MPPHKSAKSRVYVVKKTSDAYSPNVDVDERGRPCLTHPIERGEAIVIPEHMVGDFRPARRIRPEMEVMRARATARARKPKLGLFGRIRARIAFVLLLT